MFWESENAERAFLLLAVPGTDVHPAGFAGFPIGWCNLVVDRRNTSSAKGVDVTQRALIMPNGLGNLLLSESFSRSN